MVEEKTPANKRVKVSEDEEIKVWNKVDTFVEDITKNVEQFAVPKGTNLYPKIANITKLLFDFAKKTEPEPLGSLPTLLIDGFDTEQIWEEIQTYNKPLLSFFNRQLSTLEEDEENDYSDEENEEMEEGDEDDEEDEENNFEEEEDEEEVGEEDEEGEEDEFELGDENNDEGGEESEEGEDGEDNFFDANEMEEFIKDAERREAAGSDYESEDDEDDEVADIFAKFDEDSEANKLKYEDYFNQPTRHSKQQDEMAKKIAKLEAELIGDKPWQMKGEVKSKDRPKASLLEENLAFEHATKVFFSFFINTFFLLSLF